MWKIGVALLVGAWALSDAQHAEGNHFAAWQRPQLELRWADPTMDGAIFDDCAPERPRGRIESVTPSAWLLA
jgi:hypothetical protein